MLLNFVHEFVRYFCAYIYERYLCIVGLFVLFLSGTGLVWFLYHGNARFIK